MVAHRRANTATRRWLVAGSVHSWRHGWIPLTAQAAMSKNHGRKPAPGSSLAKAGAKTESKGPKVGVLADGEHAHVGETVEIHAGPHEGESGKVSSAFGKGRILIAGKNGKPGFPVQTEHAHKPGSIPNPAARNGDASKAADKSIRAKAGKMSAADHVTAATAAVKAGDHAAAVNHLTAAMGKSSGADKAAINKSRDTLTARLMGKK